LAPRRDRRRLLVLIGTAVTVVVVGLGVQRYLIGDSPSAEREPLPEATVPQPPEPLEIEGTQVEPAHPSGFETPGLLTFRGSPTRSYYGEGPVPEDPQIVWSYPDAPMCHTSPRDERTWCGTGWTGQPAVFERDERTWVVFGAYDAQLHFLDYDTGEQILPSYPMNDIVKGSVSVDPDGYPLVYAGGALADDELHVVAIDRPEPEPEQLWSLHADDVSPTMWHDDWDASALIMDDYLYQGGENSVFHIVKLNRSYDDDGLVHVDPELVFHAPGWDQELLDGLTDSARHHENVSIENSIAYDDGIAYFANGGGLVQGWDVSAIDEGVEPERVFRFWTGDDTDATITIDDEGYLYVAVEWQHQLPRGMEVGQVLKLDPDQPDDPVVWSFHDPAAGECCGPEHEAGLWATVGLHEDLIIAPTHGGMIYGLDRMSGEVRWEINRGAQTWSSPVIVDDVWIQGSCDETVRAYDVSDTTVQPPELWAVQLEGCVESTPAVWEGRVFVGARGGHFYAIGDG
jgi:WD40 repeat protein